MRRRLLLWVGDGDMAETILSYLLAEESSNPQRIRKGLRKKWAVWDQEKTASLLYPVGRGWRMGALTPRPLPPDLDTPWYFSKAARAQLLIVIRGGGTLTGASHSLTPFLGHGFLGLFEGWL